MSRRLLAATDTSPELQAVEREIAPILARHHNGIYQDTRLFARIEGRGQVDLALDAEQARVLERYHTAFVRSGAALDDAARQRLGAIAERLATLGTQFAQNVLADEQSYQLVLDGEGDLAGLPPFVRDARCGRPRPRPGRQACHHPRPLQHRALPHFQPAATRPDPARRKRRCHRQPRHHQGDHALRAEAPGSWATGASPTIAGRQHGADARGRPPYSVWGPARERALADAAELQAIAQADGLTNSAAWDWRHLAEK